MGESSKFPEILNLSNSNLKTCIMPTKTLIFQVLNSQLSLDEIEVTQRNYYNLPNSGF